jgi:DNA-directed RNA polymerase beta subunit
MKTTKTTNEVTEKHMWEVLDSYFKESGLVKQQIESYNRFAVDIA